MIRRIDAHLHLWDLSTGGYRWLTPEHGELYDSFSPDRAARVLASAGFDAAVLVQAEDSTTDTRAMLNVAAAHAWVAGVVGWVPLDDPAAAKAELDALAGEPALRGLRHLVHDDPRDDFLDLPAVRQSLSEAARRELVFDVPDAWPRHLAATGRLAAALPELTVVVDHLAKPPLADPAAMEEWRRQLAAVAALPNTVAKFSGLRLPGVPYSSSSVRPLWEIALELFGPGRLMLGSDWPVSGPSNYRDTIAVLEACIATLSPAERSAVTGGVAHRVYRLSLD